MDSSHIVEALSMPLFKNHFSGFLFSDSLHLVRKKHQFLDFYIINTNHVFGEHWFACIRGIDEWIIFDCSAFTPKKDHDTLNKTLRKEGRVVFDCQQLQKSNSLSCGMHVISYIYFAFKILKKRVPYISNYYCNKIMRFCKLNHICPDDFVFSLLYDSGIFHVAEEGKKEIDHWLKNFQ